MQLSIYHLTISIATAVIVKQLVQIFYSIFLSPLSKIPGPWYAGVTSIPKEYTCNVKKQQVHYCHALHQKYGPFVRMAPNEVLISDIGAFKEIHRTGTHFYKTSLYRYLNPTKPGHPPYGLFQEIDPLQHAARRKLLAKGFTMNHLRSNWEGAVQEKVALVMEYMKRDATKNKGEIDLVKWWPLMTGDVIATVMFGESFNMIENGKADEMLAVTTKTSKGNAFAYSFPWIYQIIRWLPIPSLQAAFQGNPVMLKRGQKAIENSKGTSRITNVFAQILAEGEKDEGQMPESEIAYQAAVFLFAGTDTTATTLTFIIWSVLSNPKLQIELEEEVAKLDQTFSDEQLEHLPVLNAVIKEALRLYGAAPAALPRKTPPTGAIFGGYYIPAGTTVATQAWSLHRNPEIFENPEQFDHTRWLSDFGSREDVKASFVPYGAGNRICLGLHLANMEMRLGTAMFLRECRGARLAASTTKESMEVENIFLIAPKGHACRIVLPVNQ